MLTASRFTASQIADRLNEPPQRICYIIRKLRLKAVHRVGIIRLFDEQQIVAIKNGLYGIQIRGQK